MHLGHFPVPRLVHFSFSANTNIKSKNITKQLRTETNHWLAHTEHAFSCENNNFKYKQHQLFRIGGLLRYSSSDNI